MRSSTTFAVIFFPKPSQRKDKLYNLFARITYDTKRVELSLRINIDLAQWDVGRARLKGSSNESRRINQYLNQINAEIFEAYDDLRKNNEVISAKAIKSRFLNEDVNTSTLIGAVEYHYKVAETTIRPGTLKNYRTTEKYIRSFLTKKMKVQDIPLSRLSYGFLTKFENYLRLYRPVSHHKPMGNNTVMKHLQRLRKIVSMTVRLEWIDKDPFINFKCTYIRKQREYLTQDELDRVEGKDFSIERLGYVRDLFVFSCYTGLSYIDAVSLTPDQIVLGIDGEQWIHTYRVKTDISVKVPLLPKAEELINKYSDDIRAQANGTVFPKISNQKLNAYLKEVADLCSITKKVTFHLARHTFATTVTLTNGVPLATVSKLLGHSQITTTQIYAKVIETKVSDDMKKLKEVMANKKTDDENPPTTIKKIS